MVLHSTLAEQKQTNTENALGIRLPKQNHNNACGTTPHCFNTSAWRNYCVFVYGKHTTAIKTSKKQNLLDFSRNKPLHILRRAYIEFFFQLCYRRFKVLRIIFYDLNVCSNVELGKYCVHTIHVVYVLMTTSVFASAPPAFPLNCSAPSAKECQEPYGRIAELVAHSV